MQQPYTHIVKVKPVCPDGIPVYTYICYTGTHSQALGVFLGVANFGKEC